MHVFSTNRVKLVARKPQNVTYFGTGRVYTVLLLLLRHSPNLSPSPLRATGRCHVGPRLQPPCSTRRRPDVEVHMHVRRVSVSAQPSTTHPSTDTGRPCRLRLGTRSGLAVRAVAGEGPDPHLHESSVAPRGLAQELPFSLRPCLDAI